MNRSGQRPPVVLPGGDDAKWRVKAVHPHAGPVWVWVRTHCRAVQHVVITTDGTPAGKRIGRPRMTANNAWVSAGRTIKSEVHS